MPFVVFFAKGVSLYFQLIDLDNTFEYAYNLLNLEQIIY